MVLIGWGLNQFWESVAPEQEPTAEIHALFALIEDDLLTQQPQSDAGYTQAAQQLSTQFPGYLHIPEGGTCEAAVRGVSELDMRNTPAGPASLLICAVGSGGTIAGLIHGAETTAVLGIAVVKDLSLPEKIKQFLPADRIWPEWRLVQALHQPRYGHFDQELWQFCQSFADQAVQLEPIYTGKALYSVFELIKSGAIPKGSRLSFFHTGGLQALKGLAYRGLINPITDSEQ